jgi:S-DNA-T family DNA segregation ATPase FtsK/SpoIIIE
MARKEPEPTKNTLREKPVEAARKEEKPKIKKEKPAKKIKKERSFPNPFTALMNLLRNEKFQRVTGLFFLLLSFYLLIAFVSYLLTWKADDNIFNSSLRTILADNSITAENWMGKMGAFLSYLFIKKWFGISSFFFIFLFFISGMKLFLNLKLVPVGKSFMY